LTLVLFSAILLSAQTSKEAALGNLVLQGLARRWKITDDPEYVAGIVQKLRLTANGPFTVKVIEPDQALANTLRGGVVYISTAVLKAAEPMELAAILVHEAAHVVAQHGAAAVFTRGCAGICTTMAVADSLAADLGSVFAKLRSIRSPRKAPTLIR
jgi:predicted Zn-dependent protease